MPSHTDSQKPRLVVKDLFKSFKLPHERHSSLKQAALNFNKRSFEQFEVLKDINFEVYDGEFFGIVGKNGSGKSTLLKLIAQIYQPTSGHVTVHGKLTPFIELGVGFNMELTGRDNVFLNGAILGLTQKEINAKYAEIVAFAELERFMDQKLKNYSSGMMVRLAFSIAIQAHTDILLVDEVLAVGDVAFQNKCLAVFRELKKQNKTIIFVSHDMESVRKFCDRAIMIENGEIIMQGNAQKVIDRYMTANTTKLNQDSPFGADNKITKDDSTVRIQDIWVADDQGNRLQSVEGDHYTIGLTFEALKECDGPIPGIILRNQQGIRVTASNTDWIKKPLGKISKGQVVTCLFTFANVLERGMYQVSGNVVSKSTDVFYDWQNDFCEVLIDQPFPTGGIAFPKYTVSIETK